MSVIYKWWLVICAGMALGLLVYFSSLSSEAGAESLGASFNNQGAGDLHPSQNHASCPSNITAPQSRLGRGKFTCPNRWFNTPADFAIIRRAAKRNNCTGDNFFLLLAIRKAESGSTGFEFGVRGVWGLDRQAGWAAATIIKNRRRWNAAGKQSDFITFLGERYCPPDAHPLNKHWVKNVKFWFERYRK